jgi:hypothetical protein
MSTKTLYTFDIIKEVEDVVVESSKDKDGNEVETKKTVKTNKPVTFAIKKPNRKLYEEAELFYGVKLSEGIKAGLLTQPLLAKRYKNDGGAMSDPEKEHYADLYYQLILKQDQLEQLKLNLESKSEEERAKSAAVIMTDIIEIQKEIQSYESQSSDLFDQTAENRAKNMTIMWWVLELSLRKDDGEFIPVFNGRNYDERIEKYDEIEEQSDAFTVEMVKKLAYFITFWYMNGVSSEEEFKKIESIYNSDEAPEEDEEQVEKEQAEAEAEAAAEEEEKAEQEKAAKKKPQAKKQKPKLDPNQPKPSPKSS